MTQIRPKRQTAAGTAAVNIAPSPEVELKMVEREKTTVNRASGIAKKYQMSGERILSLTGTSKVRCVIFAPPPLDIPATRRVENLSVLVEVCSVFGQILGKTMCKFGGSKLVLKNPRSFFGKRCPQEQWVWRGSRSAPQSAQTSKNRPSRSDSR